MTNKDESVAAKATVKAEPSVKSNRLNTKGVARGSKNNLRRNKANSSPKLSPEEKMKSMEAKIDAFFEANKEFNIKKLVSASKLMSVNANVGTPIRY